MLLVDLVLPPVHLYLLDDDVRVHNVQDGLNVKLLELVMEHLLIHWEDITDLLLELEPLLELLVYQLPHLLVNLIDVLVVQRWDAVFLLDIEIEAV